MSEKCLKQYQTYPQCCLTSNIITVSQFSKFPYLELKCHLPRVQSPVCPPPISTRVKHQFMSKKRFARLGSLARVVTWLRRTYIIGFRIKFNFSTKKLKNATQRFVTPEFEGTFDFKCRAQFQMASSIGLRLALILVISTHPTPLHPNPEQ